MTNIKVFLKYSVIGLAGYMIGAEVLLVILAGLKMMIFFLKPRVGELQTQIILMSLLIGPFFGYIKMDMKKTERRLKTEKQKLEEEQRKYWAEEQKLRRVV